MHGLQELSPEVFTFDKWGAGSLATFGIETRTWSIEQNRRTIRNNAIGYLVGNKLYVRPKKDTVAVMFFFNGEEFWTHLTNEEFCICFPELTNQIIPL